MVYHKAGGVNYIDGVVATTQPRGNMKYSYNLFLLALALSIAIPTITFAQISGTADDTQGVWLFSAGLDGTCDADGGDGTPGGAPTDDIIQDAVTDGNLQFVGGVLAEIQAFTPGSTEGGSDAPDANIAEIDGEGALDTVDDFGNISNVADDAANADLGQDGCITVGLVHPLVIVADGITATGTIDTDDLDGFDIFLFEDAELSGMIITLIGNTGSCAITLTDLQVDPDTDDRADDTLIGIDLDGLTCDYGEYLTGIEICDDDVDQYAAYPGACDPDENAPTGDTSVELDAVAIAESIELPVEMVSFDVVTGQSDANLRWVTASETNNAGFYVEHSAGFGEFNEVGFVQGAGNSDYEVSYEYRVDNLTPGLHRFRLRQLDYDGAFEYSGVVEARIEVPGNFYLSPVYPNPFNPSANVTFAVAQSQHVKISLHTLLGQEMKVLYEGVPSADTQHTVRVDGSDLTGGVYIVMMQSNGERATRTVTLLK